MHIHGLLVQFSRVSIFQLDQSGLSHRLHIIRVHVFPVVPGRLLVSIWSLDTVEGDLRADKVRLCWAEDKYKEASTGEEPLATARLASGRKESRVTKGRPLNRRQHQGAEWGPHMAWWLLLLEEQRWTHKPQQGQEPQHLKCSVITTNIAGAAKNLQECRRLRNSAFTSMWDALKRRPSMMLLAMNPWNQGTGAREMSMGIRKMVMWLNAPMGLTEKGDWAEGQERWQERMISGQAGYILQQIKQDWYPDFPIKAKHIFKEFFKLKISMLLVNTKCFPCHYRAYFCLYPLLSPSMQSSSKQTLNKSLSH